MNDPTTLISLRPVIQENFHQVIHLKVREDQKGNDVARKLYGSLGFRITGEIFEGEEVACLDLP